MTKPAILNAPEAWAVVPVEPDKLPFHLSDDFCDEPECTQGCPEAQEEIREFRRKQALKPERQRFAEVVAYVALAENDAHLMKQGYYTQQARAEAAEARVAELEARLAEAVKVIEPFSAMAGELFARNFENTDKVLVMQQADRTHIKLTFSDFRAARAFMEEKANG